MFVGTRLSGHLHYWCSHLAVYEHCIHPAAGVDSLTSLVTELETKTALNMEPGMRTGLEMGLEMVSLYLAGRGRLALAPDVQETAAGVELAD